MTRLPRVTARQIVSGLEKAGFVLVRQSGSHMIYKNAAGKRATVPFHGAKVLHPKVLKRHSPRRGAECGRADEIVVSGIAGQNIFWFWPH